MNDKPILISHHLCPYVQRAVIVLTEKGVEHERTYIDLANKPDWFTRISPLGRVPVLRIGSEVLFESQAIAEYLDEVTEGSLHPADPLAKAHQRSWIEFGSETLKAIGAFYSANADAFEAARQALSDRLERISGEIAGPYFSGEEFRMIDGVWGTVFRYFDVFDAIGDFELHSAHGAVASWRDTVSRRPSVRNAVPEGYPERLLAFLRARNSHLSTLIAT
ncbi:MAG: glutathione S-transferase family protein [Oricola sp.]